MTKKYARIDGGVVAEIIQTDGDIKLMFHPSLVWVPCDSVDGIAQGWGYADGVFSAQTTEADQALAAANYNYKALRAAAFRAEADPLFFQVQRGEATQADWIAKCNEIRARYPVEYTPT